VGHPPQPPLPETMEIHMSRSPIDFDALLREIGGGRRGEGGRSPTGPGGGGPDGPGGSGDRVRRGPRRRPPWRLYALVLAVFAVFTGFRLAVGVYTDWLWFDSLDQADVYMTRLLTPLALFALAFVAGAAWLAGNWFWAARSVSLQAAFPGQRAPWADLGDRGLRGLLGAGALILAGFTALGVAGGWPTALLYLERRAFGVDEPIFGRDVGFFVFELPFFEMLQMVAWTLLTFAVLGALSLYVLGGLLNLKQGGLRLVGPARTHLSVLVALGAWLWALGQWLERFGIVYTTRSSGAFYGAGYTDVAFRAPAHLSLAIAGVGVGILVLATVRMRSLWVPLGALAALFIVRLLLLQVVPPVVQSLRVAPDELTRETPYIEHNIAMTRSAYGLDGIAEETYAPSGVLTEKMLEENASTLENVRLWDWRALQSTFRQLQEIRQYYEFLDVDIDRYPLAGGTRQVLLSPRELTPSALTNRTWVNLHLKFTHGMGAVVTPVDEVSPQGLPVLWMKDIPPEVQAPFERTIEEPRIYFTEAADPAQRYVIVGTVSGEFDFSLNDDQELTTRYSGADGVALGSWLRRVLFALRFGDIEILLADEVTSDSRIMFRRNVQERVRALAPFLVLDPDPYLVIDESGRLVWIQDAYTVSDRYPYSQTVAPGTEDAGFAARGVNYMRNSVKVAIDAYDGSAQLYAVDPDDPVLAAWSAIYPGLLQQADGFPEDLRAHWRYPETLLRVQAAIFLRYHMDTPGAFFRTDDEWRIPTETYQEGEELPIEPYYVTMKLRGEQEAEFLLILPFTPKNRENLTAWLAARSDPPNYGELVLYRFPRGRQYFGPQQVESRIDQDTEISQQLTLWSQSGSRVIRGNLLVIPIEDVLLYVEPLFLRAESSGSALPELKRVIVADSERVVMRETLENALAALIDASAAAAAGVAAEPDDGAAPDAAAAAGDDDEGDGSGAASEAGGARDAPDGVGDRPAIAEPGPDAGFAELVQAARAREAAATRALAGGDWEAFGREMDALQALLDRLGGLAGGGTDSGADADDAEGAGGSGDDG